MKIYGYPKGDLSAESLEPSELAEITLVAMPTELRAIAKFIAAAADGIEARGKDYSHEHLSDKFKEFVNSPHFVIYNPDA
jgi:hypothetical protein